MVESATFHKGHGPLLKPDRMRMLGSFTYLGGYLLSRFEKCLPCWQSLDVLGPSVSKITRRWGWVSFIRLHLPTSSLFFFPKTKARKLEHVVWRPLSHSSMVLTMESKSKAVSHQHTEIGRTVDLQKEVSRSVIWTHTKLQYGGVDSRMRRKSECEIKSERWCSFGIFGLFGDDVGEMPMSRGL